MNKTEQIKTYRALANRLTLLKLFLFAPYTLPFSIFNCLRGPGRPFTTPVLLLLALFVFSFEIVLSRLWVLLMSAVALWVLQSPLSAELLESEPINDDKRLFFLVCFFAPELSDVLRDSGTPKSTSFSDPPEMLSGRSRERFRRGVVAPELAQSLSRVELRTSWLRPSVRTSSVDMSFFASGPRSGLKSFLVDHRRFSRGRSTRRPMGDSGHDCGYG
jgi:hypothetical protein